MKTIKIISILCFLSISFSQDIDKHSVFIKAQYVPTVGAEFKLSQKISLRPSIMATISNNSSFIVNAALIFNTKSNDLLTKYIGTNFTYESSLDGIYAGLLAGVKTNINNKIGVFGEIGLDVGLFGDGIESIGLQNTGVGINYFLGK